MTVGLARLTQKEDKNLYTCSEGGRTVYGLLKGTCGKELEGEEEGNSFHLCSVQADSSTWLHPKGLH